MTDIYGFGWRNYQDHYTLRQFDATKSDTFNKKILVKHLVYAKIKSLDGKDSLEYDNKAGEIWRIVKRRNNVTLLYREYYYWAWTANDGNTPNTEMILLKNAKKIRDIRVIWFDKKWLVKFISKRYNQKFSQKQFKDADEAIDYIMDWEGHNTLN